MQDHDTELPESAAKLYNLVMNWLLPIAALITLVVIWIAVARGWENGPIANVVILISGFFIIRSLYHFVRRQNKK